MINQELILLNDLLLKDISDLDDAEKILAIEDKINRALDLDKRKWGNRELSKVSIRTKKATRKKVELGDIFEIYLESENIYNYTIVVKLEDEKEEGQWAYSLFGFLNYFSEYPASIEELVQILKLENIFMFADSGLTGVIDGDWRKVSKWDVDWQIDFTKIEYLTVEDGGVLRPNDRKYYKTVGHPNDGNLVRIDYEEAITISNPNGMVGQKWVEAFLGGSYKGKTLVEINEEILSN
ncbi:hypothetical protein [Listeria booriae]|uniref:hypothetical protein n=1 Tax=Listeria booriae TaxID=1552123 RepID=UPI001625C102|nr:hypothetical protein [Listeria booriae]MBC1504362.1 hypothetical protein [Listeria booriae]